MKSTELCFQRVSRIPELSRALIPVACDPERCRELHGVVGEFCHAARNQLNTLRMSLYFARQDSGDTSGTKWDEAEKRYRALERFVRDLQTICHPLQTTPILVALGAVIRDRQMSWSQILSARRIEVEWAAPVAEVTTSVDAMQMADALDGFVRWRSAEASPGTRVAVAWQTKSDESCFSWRERTEPRTARSHAGEQAVSLALPLLAKVIAGHHGTIRVEEADDLTVELRWPLLVNSAQG